LSQPAPSEASPKAPAKLLRASIIVSFMTMFSRVLGLARDVVFAWFIGASGGAAFFVAFKIPNFLRRLFAEGAFAQAFVPVLSEYRTQGPHYAVKAFVDRVAGCLGVSVVGVSALAVVGAPVVAMVFAPGFYWKDPVKYQLTVDLIRVTFPYLALISLAGLAGAILNSYDRLIAFAIFVSPHLDVPVMALGWAVLAAGVAQLLFQLPFLARIHLLPAPKVDWKDESVKKVLKLMAPAMFAVSVSQINLLFDTIIASLLADKSVSWLYYSDRLIELPLGVFGVAIATVILPALSRQHADGAEGYHKTMDWALRMVLLIAVPAAAALILLARAYALGLAAFMLIKVLVTGYFSRQDTMTPTKIGVIAMVTNMVFNVALVVPFHSFWGVGHVGLALATAASACLNAYLLLRGLRRGGHYQPEAGWLRFFTTLMLATGCMAGAIMLALNGLPDFAELLWWRRILSMFGVCALGFCVYVSALWCLGWRIRHLRPKTTV